MKKQNKENMVHEPMAVYTTERNLFANIIGNSARQFGKIENYDLLQQSRKGLAKNIILSLAKKISINIQELADIMHISERTLQRYDDDEIVKTEYAEKAIELARLYTRGLEVFESMDNLKIWMKTPSIIFNGESPLSLLDTSIGFDMVLTELGRIEHGIFA